MPSKLPSSIASLDGLSDVIVPSASRLPMASIARTSFIMHSLATVILSSNSGIPSGTTDAVTSAGAAAGAAAFLPFSFFGLPPLRSASHVFRAFTCSSAFRDDESPPFSTSSIICSSRSEHARSRFPRSCVISAVPLRTSWNTSSIAWQSRSISAKPMDAEAPFRV